MRDSHGRQVLLVEAQARTHGMGDGIEQVIDTRALRQVDLAQRIQREAFAVVMLGVVEKLDRRTRIQFVVDLAQVADHRRLVAADCGHGTLGCALHFRHVRHQHRVVRGHRAPRLGEHARRRQSVLGAGLGQRLHDVGGVLVEPRQGVAHRVEGDLLVALAPGEQQRGRSHHGMP